MMMRKIFFFLLALGLFSSVAAQDVNVSNGFAFDGEPFLSVNPADPHHFVVAWMGFKLNENLVIKTSVSTDAGVTWSTPVSVPHTLAGHTAADPSLRWDHAGNLFLCFIDYNNVNFSTGAIEVCKSTDGGMSWGPPAEVISVTECPGKYCIDRPWMAIDTTAGPNQGNIYVTSMNGKLANGNPPYNPYFMRSTDGGGSFEPPRFLDTLNWLAGSLVPQPMPSPTVSANGVLFATYPSYVVAQNVFPQVILASSQDGGANFAHNSAYVINSAGANDSLAKKGPLLIADPADGDHLVYLAVRGQSGDLDITMIESTDGGQNWTQEIRINDDPIGNGVLQDMVWADFDADGDLAVCWRDRRNAGGTGYARATEMYTAVRWKDSTNFSANQPLSSAAANFDVVLNEAGNDFMGVEFVDDTLSAAWGDVRNGTLSIWFTRMAMRSGMTSTYPIVSEPSPQEIAYPNPAGEWIELTEVEGPFSFQIVDLQGRRVKEAENWRADRIEVADLKPGVYFLNWSNEKGNGILRVIKD
jgi:hypothetical protein